MDPDQEYPQYSFSGYNQPIVLNPAAFAAMTTGIMPPNDFPPLLIPGDPLYQSELQRQKLWRGDEHPSKRLRPEAWEPVEWPDEAAEATTPPPCIQKQMLDHTMFPHILDLIVQHASRDSLLALRGVSRKLRIQCDRLLTEHIIVHSEEHDLWDGPGISRERYTELSCTEGRLPMFMNWFDLLQENLFCKTLVVPFEDDDGLDMAWVQKPVPKVLYPGMIDAIQARNAYARALNARGLLEGAEVLDIAGPVPIARQRELLSGLDRWNSTIRLRPDGEGRSVWSLDPGFFYEIEFDDIIEGRGDPEAFRAIHYACETLVHFQNIADPSNVETIIQAAAANVTLIHLRIQKLVIHFTIDPEEVKYIAETWRHRLGYRMGGHLNHIVIIFQSTDWTGYYPPDDYRQPDHGTQSLAHLLSKFLRDIALYLPRCSVAFVNTCALLPSLLGLPWDTPWKDMPEEFDKFFEKRIPESVKRTRGDQPPRWRTIDLLEYAWEVGTDQLKLETDGYNTRDIFYPNESSSQAMPKIIPADSPFWSLDGTDEFGPLPPQPAQAAPHFGPAFTFAFGDSGDEEDGLDSNSEADAEDANHAEVGSPPAGHAGDDSDAELEALLPPHPPSQPGAQPGAPAAQSDWMAIAMPWTVPSPPDTPPATPPPTA